MGTEEIQSREAGQAAVPILAALDRFLHSPLKLKHPRRTARQALAFVVPDA